MRINPLFLGITLINSPSAFSTYSIVILISGIRRLYITVVYSKEHGSVAYIYHPQPAQASSSPAPEPLFITFTADAMNTGHRGQSIITPQEHTPFFDYVLKESALC